MCASVQPCIAAAHAFNAQLLFLEIDLTADALLPLWLPKEAVGGKVTEVDDSPLISG